MLVAFAAAVQLVLCEVLLGGQVGAFALQVWHIRNCWLVFWL